MLYPLYWQRYTAHEKEIWARGYEEALEDCENMAKTHAGAFKHLHLPVNPEIEKLGEGIDFVHTDEEPV
jgi:hypothetical protein